MLRKKIIEDYKSYRNRPNYSFINSNMHFFYSSGYRATVLFRYAHYLRNRKFRLLAILLEKVMHFTTNTWIGTNADIGGGFVVRHVGTVVVGNLTKIGNNCEIRQGVTFGGNLGKIRHETSQPIIGNNVLVGAGAKILGPVIIGDNCIIGANSVVTKDIPKNSVVSGIPGKVIREIRKNENYLVD